MKFRESGDTERFVISPDYVLQQKFDGMRVLVHWPSRGVSTRAGSPVKFSAARLKIPAMLADLEAQIGNDPMVERTGEFYLDGELIIETGVFHVFDLIQPGQEDEPYYERLTRLTAMIRHDSKLIRRVHTVWGQSEKKQFLDTLEERGVEGGIFRNIHEAYVEGRSEHSVKVKFVKSADVIVHRVSPGSSAEFGVYNVNEDGVLSEFRPIGSTSLIGKEDVRVGDVIEVKYLYWTGSAMIQPTLVRVREDKKHGECTTEQFPEYSREAVK